LEKTQSFFGPVIGYEQMIVVKSRNRIHAYAGFGQSTRDRCEWTDCGRDFRAFRDRAKHENALSHFGFHISQ
jgi:hypothetical protein